MLKSVLSVRSSQSENFGEENIFSNGWQREEDIEMSIILVS